MANCPHCKGLVFSLQEAVSITNIQYKMFWIVCSQCQAPVTLLSQVDAGVAALDAAKRTEALEKQVAILSQKLDQIISKLNRF